MTITTGQEKRQKRQRRVRARVFGTEKRPRLSVFRSLRGVYAQVIDDDKKKTLVSADLKEIKGKNSLESAKKIGALVASKCQKLKILEVVFDRGGYRYHGKVKALAEGAREGGLKF
jgi:large subunit ribosomal protein L18